MNKVAFVTYNTVDENLTSGWHESEDRHAMVLQNTKGEGTRDGGPIGRDNRQEQISTLWKELQQVLSELDQVVVYVGTNGSERAIALASELPADKVTFVGCDCNLPMKEIMIQAVGLGKARRILCECGGHHTMKGLYDRFMATGTLG